jgi:hypothetical protein
MASHMRPIRHAVTCLFGTLSCGCAPLVRCHVPVGMTSGSLSRALLLPALSATCDRAQVLGVVYHPDVHCHVITTEDLLGQHWLRVFEADGLNEVRPPESSRVASRRPPEVQYVSE